MIDIQNETLLRVVDVPKWTEEFLRRRVHKSTVHRWHLRGCRGVRLETLMVGGIRHTSHESLKRFFDRITVAADREADGSSHSGHVLPRSHQRAAQELASEGF